MIINETFHCTAIWHYSTKHTVPGLRKQIHHHTTNILPQCGAYLFQKLLAELLFYQNSLKHGPGSKNRKSSYHISLQRKYLLWKSCYHGYCDAWPVIFRTDSNAPSRVKHAQV